MPLPAIGLREKYGIVHSMGPALEITTMIGCPLMCTYCPQTNLKKAYKKDEKYMSLQTLDIALEKMPINSRIDFSGMSEPWANPNATDLIELTLQKGFKIAIFTTLYGLKVTEVERVQTLLEKYNDQVEILCLHLPDDNNNMKGWRYSEEWEQVYKKIIQTKIDCGVGAMTMDSQAKIHRDIINFARPTFEFSPHTRAGSLDEEQIGIQPISITPKHTSKLTCRSTPFYDRGVLLPNGDVALCCMDYDLKHIVGNLLNDSWDDLFTSKSMLKLVEINESPGFCNDSICKSCTNVRYIA